MTTRVDGRHADDLREVTIEKGWSAQAEGSALVSFGNTKVLCTASFTNGVPRWLAGKGKGWVTAEYAMLPRATNSRNDRESVKGKIGGRTHEISRLIGRSLRAVVDMKALGENTIVLDCDVLQADGGTRTAAITGAYVALAQAIEWGREKKFIGQKAVPLIDSVSAVSVGIIDGEPMLDLAYVEDVRAETDMNVVVTGGGKFVEVQGTAEGAPFDRDELNALLDLALGGAIDLSRIQAETLASPGGGLVSQVVIATHNAHKVEELQRILGDAIPGVELVAYQGPEPVEDGDSFEANALIKARAAAEYTGLPAIADDSGITVDALDGAPGIHSARYAGTRDDSDNVQLLLTNLRDAGDRHAQFVCAAALVVPPSLEDVGPDGPADSVTADEYVEVATWAGDVLDAPAGSGGFGYDPVFRPEGETRSAAELSEAEKDAGSHRAQAFRALAPRIAALG